MTAGSITALFLRGFQLQDLPKHFNYQTLQTPKLKVWMIEVQDFNDKMTAYKMGVASAKSGLGVYVVPDGDKWKWVAGVFMTENEALQAISDSKVNNLTCQVYEIESKSFNLMSEASEPCRQTLTAVQKIFQLLLELRNTKRESRDFNQLVINITSQYNKIKNSVEVLQSLNTTLKSDLIASIIYTANLNILSLQEIIYGNNQECSLATINTVLLKTIFSLDNF